MTNGLKVYYLPLNVFYDQVTLPTLFSYFFLFRNILIREQISIVHAHQSTSTLTNESILLARTMGYKVCYTDHSLFGFDEVSSIHINKIMTITLSDVDQAIAVSNICKENLTLRARLHPSRISTIPNAVDPTRFTPDPSLRSPSNTVNIVLLSRLVYRKGIDLACKIIPIVCAKFPSVYFIIGGNGPKKLALEEMREQYQLHDRVELLGAVPHNKVRGEGRAECPTTNRNLSQTCLSEATSSSTARSQNLSASLCWRPPLADCSWCRPRSEVSLRCSHPP